VRNSLRQARIDLAAVLRWAARLGYQVGVCNHFSLMVPDRDDLFLVNPEGLFWSEITASSLIVCDLDGRIVEGEGTVEQTAFCLHAPIHRAHKAATAVLHTHSPYSTALCLLQGGRLEPSEIGGLQFYGRIAYDEDFTGAALTTAEGDRVAALMGDKSIIMLRNHGPMVTAPNIAAAFDRLYYLEEAAKRQVIAMSTGQPLSIVPAGIGEAMAANAPVQDAYAEKHLAAIKRVLDRECPEYAN
jgi:ribulose-5-phosphate 4-epimerase/fuculose-1-phosphate aldolase